VGNRKIQQCKMYGIIINRNGRSLAQGSIHNFLDMICMWSAKIVETLLVEMYSRSCLKKLVIDSQALGPETHVLMLP
jgi:hypothetical protein